LHIKELIILPILRSTQCQKSERKNKSCKKLGGQPGYKDHSGFLYSVDECENVLNRHPQTCRYCGEKLRELLLPSNSRNYPCQSNFVSRILSPFREDVCDIPSFINLAVRHALVVHYDLIILTILVATFVGLFELKKASLSTNST